MNLNHYLSFKYFLFINLWNNFINQINFIYRRIFILLIWKNVKFKSKSFILWKIILHTISFKFYIVNSIRPIFVEIFKK